MRGVVLIDTSAWIEYFREDALKRDQVVADEVRGVIEEDRAAITEPIFIEVAIGARDRKQLGKWRKAFSEFQLHSVERAIWLEAVDYGFALGRNGIHVPVVDLLIATIACRDKLTVLHKGEKHFPLMAPVMGFSEYSPSKG